MKGDFSRDTFDPKNHFARVLMQQGRVQTDADWNEQGAQVEYRVETEGADVIGACGAPIHEAGFAITSDGNTLYISAGRMYVDGILVENETDALDYFDQPDLPNFYLPDLPDPRDITRLLQNAKLTTGIAYLDVWQRHMSALDVPQIREVALGGPDTTTRAKVVWQVKVLPIAAGVGVPASGETPTCDSDFAEWDSLTTAPTGLLSARTSPLVPTTDECQIPPSAGYTRLENQLYRVEIHQGGNFSTDPITFKWSRDNGTVVTLIEKISGHEITVHDVGPDDVLGFANGQLVEVIDDALELNGQRGQLIRIADVNTATRVITLASSPGLLYDATRHPKLRRWDGAGDVKSDGTWQALEGGVEVQFATGSYNTGDYWLIPARAATGEIEWPRDAAKAPIPQPRRGIIHHYCRLGLVSIAGGSLAVTADCRKLFPPLTDIKAALVAQAIHVTDTNWMNDDLFDVDQFLSDGLSITLSVAPDPISVSDATMIVTMEFPQSMLAPGGETAAFGPGLILNFILDGTLKIDTGPPYALHWRPLDRLGSWLEPLVRRVDALRRLRVRVTLKGHLIWSDTDGQRLYLDGQAFGEPSVRADGKTPRTALHPPSGDVVRASDFESWFYLEKPPVRKRAGRGDIVTP